MLFCLVAREETGRLERVKNYLYNYLFKEIELYEVFKEAGVKPISKSTSAVVPQPITGRNFGHYVIKFQNFLILIPLILDCRNRPGRVGVDRLKFYSEDGC